MEKTDNNKVHYIPKDAQIPIEVGSGFLQRMQKVLIFMLQDKTPEEIEMFKTMVQSDTVPEDTWMYHYMTIQSFVTITEKTAFDKGLTIEKDIDETTL